MSGNKKKKLFSFMSFFKAKKEYASDEDNIVKVVTEPQTLFVVIIKTC